MINKMLDNSEMPGFVTANIDAKGKTIKI